jgi:hypothetical protein
MKNLRLDLENARTFEKPYTVSKSHLLENSISESDANKIVEIDEFLKSKIDLSRLNVRIF